MMTQCKNLNQNSNAGFAFVETLITSILVLIALIGLNSAVSFLTKTHRDGQLIVNGVVAESRIIASVLDRNTYDSSGVDHPLLKALRDNTSASLLTQLRVPLQLTPTSPIYQITPELGVTTPQPINFAPNGNTCTGFPTSSCSVAVRVAINFNNSPVGWAYAKRVVAFDGSSNAVVKDRLVDLNVPFSTNNAGGSNDFNVYIPSEFYSKDFIKKCDTSTTFGATGIIANTGELICEKTRPMLGCTRNTFPIGITTDASGNLVNKCSDPLPILKCPVGYRLLSLESAKLYPGQNAAGTCVFATQKQATYTENGSVKEFRGNKMWGIVCPEGYQASQSSCKWYSDPTNNDSNTLISNGNYIPPNYINAPDTMPINRYFNPQSPRYFGCEGQFPPPFKGRYISRRVAMNVVCTLDTTLHPEQVPL